MDLSKIIKERILLLDGAMGTMIQSYGLSEADFRGKRFSEHPILMKGNNDILNITRPDVVEDIHRKYLTAGADIIETNTFSAQRISMADYGITDCVVEIVEAGCKIARKIADEFTALNSKKPRFVAGAVGPTNRSCSISPDIENPAYRNVTFNEMAEAYIEQMSTMLRCGVDIILIETVFDTLNAKAALYAAEEVMKIAERSVPIMLSLTIADHVGRTLSGQTIEAFIASIEHAPLFSIGINCSFGAKQLKPFLKTLSSIAPCYISVYPNAGLPNEFGGYDQTPEQMVAEMKEYIDEGLVNIIGGCCGTTDKYISRFNNIIKDADGKWQPPHIPNKGHQHLWLSGLEKLEVSESSNFINIGERCNVAGSRKFLRLIKEKKYDEALQIARQQVEDGAQILDVNMDDGLINAKYEMVNFLNIMMSDPDIARVPIMIDSSDWNVIEAGLKCVQGKSIVNSITLKEGEAEFIRKAQIAKRLGAAVVVMAFDEAGQAVTIEHKTAVCARSFNLLTEVVGMKPHDIIFDPNILSIATGIEEHSNYAINFLKASEWIKKNLPGTHISGGISNLSFSLRGNNYLRESMHSVFLYHSIKCGQDMGIINPATNITYDEVPESLRTKIEDVIFNKRPDATEILIEEAEIIKDKAMREEASPKNHAWRNGDIETRLKHSLIRGVTEYLENDIREALNTYNSPIEIIEGPLMEAMNTIGEMFGEGKIFLPQVVKSARTMKKAVSFIEPFIHSNGQTSVKSGKIVLATVKGDVHDIGKNIVSVIMGCNNYEIIDLGVMVPAEKIVQTAINAKADIIGLSGLITPSLEEMINVAKELEKAGVNIPLMIGGATTSEIHTALKIAPAYSAPVVWMKDASLNSSVASMLINPNTRSTFIEELNNRYNKLRQHEGNNTSIIDIERARSKKLKLY